MIALLALTDDATLAAVTAVLVGVIGMVSATIAAVSSISNRREISRVRYEVSPNGGSSSYDMIHRLVWETHEQTAKIPELVARVDKLEESECPFFPGKEAA